jgi:hypothetical protein
MSTVKDEVKISEMTAGQLRELIMETIHEALDPDHDLQLHPDVKAELRDALANPQQGVPLEQAIKELGLQ